MRIPLTKYGLPQVALFPGILVAVMVAIWLIGTQSWPTSAVTIIEAVLLVVLIWILSFFRDPARNVPQDHNVLLAPADGRITDIEIVERNPHFEGQAIKIGIFLSIFNVHINRAPCHVKIEKIIYRKGQFKNAMNSEAQHINESNDILMTRLDAPRDTLLVRQISGAIARRIVCEAKPGRNFTGGQKFGMIKFGSRTELFLPFRENVKHLVKVNDKVKAGLTPLVRYE